MTDPTNPQFVRSFVNAATTGTFFHDLLRLHHTRKALIPLQLQELEHEESVAANQTQAA